MNILNQPINPGGHPVFPAAKEISSPLTPASVRFDGPPRRVSGYVAVEQQLGAPPAPAPFTLDFLRSLLDGDDGPAPPAPPRPVALRVVVTSAVELDARQTELIARKMRRVTGFANLTIESAVDPSLIAGFVVCYGTDDDGSHVIDLSVKGKLDAIKNRADSIDQTAHDHAHR